MSIRSNSGFIPMDNTAFPPRIAPKPPKDEIPKDTREAELYNSEHKLADVPQAADDELKTYLQTNAKASLWKQVQDRRSRQPDKPYAEILLDMTKGKLFAGQAHKILRGHGYDIEPRRQMGQTPDGQQAYNAHRVERRNLEDFSARFVHAQDPIDISSRLPTEQPRNSDAGPAIQPTRDHHNYDYGELARNSASASLNIKTADDNSSGQLVRLHQLSEEDQLLQSRYFAIIDLDALVHCLSCGGAGHTPNICPSLRCTHCNAYGQHLSSDCPKYVKCGRCRKRGHHTTSCNASRSVEAGGPDDPCDICGDFGHPEELCSGLYCTFNPTPQNIKKIPRAQMRVGCYNCGSKWHWGSDCHKLPDFLAHTKGKGVWSEKYASMFILEDPSKGEEVAGGYGKRDGGRNQNYQLALLDNARD
jgi:hypothetical protein